MNRGQAEKLVTAAEAEQIDQVCDRFEKAIKAKLDPSVQGFCKLPPGPARSVLLYELLLLELDSRFSKGENPTLDEYQERYPDDAPIVEDVFEQIRWAAVQATEASPAPSVPPQGSDSVSSEQPKAFGEYIVLEKLGAGGMGQVFKALHPQMHRLAAVKTLNDEVFDSPDAIDRFFQEVQVAAGLNHSNIVMTYHAGLQDDRPYLVMEYVEGRDMAGLLAERGSLPIGEAVDYIVQAAQGLQYAHGSGIIHRDIKPQNLLVDRSGTVKILDMGLARRVEPLDSAEESSSRLTQSSHIMGSWDYLSPEQAEDPRDADARSDVYSLGCTLYRLLTNRPIYVAETTMKRLIAHREAPIPSLCDARPEAPTELDAVFQRMVAKRPENRFASMDEVIEALKPFAVPSEAPTAAYGESSLSAEETPLPSEVDTDSELLQPQTQPSAEQPPRSRKWTIGLIAGGLLLSLLAFQIMVRIRDEKGNEIATYKVPDGGTVEIEEVGKAEGEMPSEKGAPAASPKQSIDDQPTEEMVAEAGKPAGEETPAKLESLFDGKTLTGWQGPSEHYSVEDGTLVADFGPEPVQGEDGNLLSDKKYLNFTLRLEFRIVVPDSASGIVLRCPATQGTPLDTLTIRIVDESSPTAQALKPTERTGALSGLAAPTGAQPEPVGEWNTMEIRCDGTQLTVALNGKTILEVDLATLETKQADGTPYRVPEEAGHVGVQGVGSRGRIEFRKMEIGELGGAQVSPGPAVTVDSAMLALKGVPKLYPVCLNQPSEQEVTLVAQANLLRALGYDGIGFGMDRPLSDDPSEHLAALNDAGMELYLVPLNVNVGPDKPPFDPRVREAIPKLKGKPVTIAAVLKGYPAGDVRGMEPAIQALRELGDLAAGSDLRIAIHHHALSWTKSFLHAIEVAKQTGHPRVGVNFNVSHWLNVDGDKDYRPSLREHADRIFGVTLNGAEVDANGVTGPVLPLDRGNFDNQELLLILREIGYDGPIGLMCWGIPDDTRDHLERSMRVWRSWHQPDQMDGVAVDVGLRAKASPSTVIIEPQPITIQPGEPLAGSALVQQPASINGLRSWTITTRGHRGRVLEVAYSPDGNWIASGGEDRDIRIWDAETGELDRVLVSHTGAVNHLAWSPDSRYLASCTGGKGGGAWVQDGTLRVWDVRLAQLVRTERDMRNLSGLRWSPDGRLFAASQGNEIVVCEVRQWKERHRFDAGRAGGLTWSRDGKILCGRLSGDGGSLQQWNAETGELIRSVPTPSGHDCYAGGVWSEDLRFGAAVVDSGKHVVLLDGVSGEQLAEIAWTSGQTPFGVAFSPDGKWLACHGSESSIRVLNTETGAQLQPVDVGMHNNLCISWSPNRRRFVTGCGSGAIRVVDMDGTRISRSEPYRNSTFNTTSPAISPDGKSVVFSVADATLLLSIGATHEVPRVTDFHATSFAWSPRGMRLACGEQGGPVAVWDSSLHEIVPELEGSNSPHHLLAWASDGKRLAVGKRFRSSPTVHVFDDALAKPILMVDLESDVTAVEWSKDCRFLALGLGDGNVQIWDVDDGKLIEEFRAHAGQFDAIAWSSDGSVLATKGADGNGQSIKVWDWTTSKTATFQSEGHAVFGDLLFSSDKSKLFYVAPGDMGGTWNWLDDKLTLSWPASHGISVNQAGNHVTTFEVGNRIRQWHDTADQALNDVRGPAFESPRFGGPGADWSLEADVVASDTDARDLFLWRASTGESIVNYIFLKKTLVAITPDGHYRHFLGDNIDEEIVYVALTDDGSQRTLTPAQFEAEYGWKNDPSQIALKEQSQGE